MTPNTRSYIKNYGRTAHANQTPQLESVYIDDEVIGEIHVDWVCCEWVFTAKVFHNDSAFKMSLNTLVDANKWIGDRRLELNRHESFGAYIRHILNDTGLTIARLAGLLDVSRQTVHVWIKDESLPSLNSFIDLAYFYSKMIDSDVNTILVDMADSIH